MHLIGMKCAMSYYTMASINLLNEINTFHSNCMHMYNIIIIVQNI